MINFDDIVEIASSIHNALLVTGKEKGLKENITVNIGLDEIELHGIDRELYVMKHKESAGFKPADEVDAAIMGVNFKLTVAS